MYIEYCFGNDGGFVMKKKVCVFLAICLCLLAYTTTTVFAFDVQVNSEDANPSDFQPGSGGMLCKDRNGKEYFIPPKEVLPNRSYNVAGPYLPEPLDRGYIQFAKFEDYKPVVMVKSWFYINGETKIKMGTGSFIGPTGILTCAHALYDRDSGTWPYKTYVYSNYMSDTNYGKRYEVNDLFIGGEYVNTDLDDWGMVTVTERTRVGYYGFDSTTKNSDLIGLDVTCVGYGPAEGQLSFLDSKGVITKHPVTKALSGLFIEGEARKGMSGGPVMAEKGFIKGIMIRAGDLTYTDDIKEEAIAMLIINPWLWDTIYDHSGR